MAIRRSNQFSDSKSLAGSNVWKAASLSLLTWVVDEANFTAME
jgi:hypothetical protein